MKGSRQRPHVNGRCGQQQRPTQPQKNPKSQSSFDDRCSSDKSTNRPRNLLVTDATKPYKFTYTYFGRPSSVTINQTPADDTWPGGALWDIGVLLSQVLVGLTTGKTSLAHTGKQAASCNHRKADSCPATSSGTALPSRLVDAFPSTPTSWKDWTVLELGCGVGLTGLVAASTLGPKLTILTDLKVVIDNVTQPNVLINTATTTSSGVGGGGKKSNLRHRHLTMGKRGRVLAMPLYWGERTDEQQVCDVLVQTISTKNCNRYQRSKRNEKKHNKEQDGPQQQQQRKLHPGKKILAIPIQSTTNECSSLDMKNEGHDQASACYPDLIIVGDVAYQHKPGAPSHFDALVSTIQQFLGVNTLVLFGTRMRMPASADLLDMFHTIMEEIVVPPVCADEIDPSFGNMKHQITIHLLQKRRGSPCNQLNWT